MKPQTVNLSFPVFKQSKNPPSDAALVQFLSAILAKGAKFRFRASGISMSPFIRDGDLLTVSPLARTSPRFGDVVVYIHPGRKGTVIHRIVGKKRNFYLIKGDNSTVMDRLIPKENILGYVTSVDREGKRVVFGFGPERFLVAILNRAGLQLRLFFRIWRLFRTTMKRVVS